MRQVLFFKCLLRHINFLMPQADPLEGSERGNWVMQQSCQILRVAFGRDTIFMQFYVYINIIYKYLLDVKLDSNFRFY